MPAADQNPAEAVHVQARLDARERRNDMLIGILRRTPIFDQLVKRFVEGQSVVRVATWVYDLKPEGPLKDGSYNSIRTYLTALRARVRNEIADHLQKRHERVVKEEEIVQTIQAKPLPPHRIDRFKRTVDKALREVEAIDLLKYAFLRQEERVHEMRLLEARTQGMLIPNGYKEIELLKTIADSIAKINMGTEILRGKRLLDSTMPPIGK